MLKNIILYIYKCDVHKREINVTEFKGASLAFEIFYKVLCVLMFNITQVITNNALTKTYIL